MTDIVYDVFLSYRRAGGAAEARLIQAALRARGIRAFLDVTELGRGYFDEALLRHIEQIPNFLVILSPQSLDRSERDEDWLRKEIAQALASERNVVPIIMPGFQFPAKLPADIKNLPRHQGMDYSHLYFDAMLQKLIATLDLPEGVRQEARRHSFDQRQAEVAHQRARGQPRGERPPQRWSDRFVLGDAGSGEELQQAALSAFWTSFALGLAYFATASRGNEAQAFITAGAICVALALWVRVQPRQAMTTGLVIGGLVTIGSAGAAVTNNFDLGRATFMVLAALVTGAFWQLSRLARSRLAVASAQFVAATNIAPAPDSESKGPFVAAGSFGSRLADECGFSAAGADMSRLRWFFAARLASWLVLGLMLQARQVFGSQYSLNILLTVWGAASFPLAAYVTFRVLRQPLLSLVVAAFLTAVVNPLFWRDGLGVLVLSQEVVGVLLFAWATTEVQSARAAMWFGAASAGFAAMVMQSIKGFRPYYWSQASPILLRTAVVAFAFWVVFAAGLALRDRPKTASG